MGSTKVIAITGGPCAGKTSAMSVLRERLECAGVNAAFIAEAATDLIQGGIAPWTCASMLEFQTRVMALQLERENAAIAKAADLVKDWELDYMDGIDGITGEILFTVRP